MLSTAIQVTHDAALAVVVGQGGVEELASAVHHHAYAFGFPVDVVRVALGHQYLHGQTVNLHDVLVSVNDFNLTTLAGAPVQEETQVSVGGVGSERLYEVFQVLAHLAPHIEHDTIELARQQVMP